MPKQEVYVERDTYIKPKRIINYLNNKDLLVQIALSKKQGKMTDELAKMLMLLTARYAKKSNFANYSFNNDLKSHAHLMIVRTWHTFNENKSKNPFAYFTQIIKNCFIQFLNSEKKQRNIRDGLLAENGMNTSFSYQDSDNAYDQPGDS